jgi:hypothetical protein
MIGHLISQTKHIILWIYGSVDIILWIYGFVLDQMNRVNHKPCHIIKDQLGDVCVVLLFSF